MKNAILSLAGSKNGVAAQRELNVVCHCAGGEVHRGHTQQGCVDCGCGSRARGRKRDFVEC